MFGNRSKRNREIHAYEIERRHAPGTSPGTIEIDKTAPKPEITVIAYSKSEFVEKKIGDPEEISAFLDKWPVTWVNVAGLGDEDTIRAVAKLFKLHSLALEDVVHTHQRAKVEEYQDHLYTVVRIASYDNSTMHVDTEQISMFLGGNYVLSFDERTGDCFDPVRDRIRIGKGRIRSYGPDYLLYSLIDTVIDEYFPILEDIGEHLEELEEETLGKPDQHTVSEIHDVKRSMITLRRAVWPLRELVNNMLRAPSSLFTDETKLYLRDCYDHAIGIMDLIESYRDISSGLIDIYLSSVSNKMNEVMKVLTMIATIFIPITWIAGIYGMNFKTDVSPFNMPELSWVYGYPFFWTVTLSVGIFMLFFFRRKKWI